MNITDFSTELFCKVDDAVADAPRHSQGILSVGELVIICAVYAAQRAPEAFSIRILRTPNRKLAGA